MAASSSNNVIAPSWVPLGQARAFPVLTGFGQGVKIRIAKGGPHMDCPRALKPVAGFGALLVSRLGHRHAPITLYRAIVKHGADSCPCKPLIKLIFSLTNRVG